MYSAVSDYTSHLTRGKEESGVRRCKSCIVSQIRSYYSLIAVDTVNNWANILTEALGLGEFCQTFHLIKEL